MNQLQGHADNDRQAEGLRARVAVLEAQVEQLRSQLAERDDRERELGASLAWTAVGKFQALRLLLAPRGSARERLFRVAALATLRPSQLLQGFHPRAMARRWLHEVARKVRPARGSTPTVLRRRSDQPDLSWVTAEGPDNQVPLGARVSVVIPTLNAGRGFDDVLNGIKGQKGLGGVEIIIVDSGTSDGLLDMAEEHGARVVLGGNRPFDHGEVRQRGVEAASGDFVILTVQDAIPIGDYCFREMVDMLISSENMAATMARQIPRSDATIYACWSIWNYYESLGLRYDKERSLGPGQDFDSLPLLAKRGIAQLDNVCSCYRRDILRDHGFGRVRHAEDLELGIRLLKAGFSLGYTASAGFVHSHSRSPAYIFKRSYMDRKAVTTMLGWPRAEAASSVGQTLAAIARLQEGLAKATHDLRAQRVPGMGETLGQLGESLAGGLDKTETAVGAPRGDSELRELLTTLLRAADGAELKDEAAGVDLPWQRFIHALETMQGFLSSTGALNRDSGDEAFRAAQDLLADVGGSLLAECLAETRSDGESSHVTGRIDKLLAAGI